MSKENQTPEVIASTLAVTLLGVSAPAAATTYQVDSLRSSVNPSDGLTTLREAIQQANASPGTDVVTFASELSGTINTGGSNSLPPVYDSLVILGDGRITLDGGGDPYILGAVYGGEAAASGDLTVSGMTLTGASGPAIYAYSFPYGLAGGNLTVDNTVITGNGAAVSSIGKYQTTVIKDSSITGNSGPPSGEGAYFTTGAVTQFSLYGGSSLTVENATIANNQAPAGGVAIAQGGEGSEFTGTAVISNSDITGNIGQEAGGLYASYSDLTVENSVVSGNQATGAVESGRGGGIRLDSSFAEITDTRVNNNTAAFDGGGIYSSNGELDLDSVEVRGNTASSGYGGGIFSRPQTYESGSFDIHASLVAGNSASSSGGGIHVAFDEVPLATVATVDVSSTVIRDNQAGDSGGGLHVSATDPDIDEGNVTVSGSILSGNTAQDVGGGMRLDSVTMPLTLDNSRVTGNNAALGGGLSLNLQTTPDYTTELTGSVISGNTASTGSGGGVDARLYSTNSLQVEDTRISGNSANSYGGGINVSTVEGNSAAGALYLDRSTLDANYADLGGGVAVFGYEYALLGVTNSTISGNSAATGAPGLYLGTSNVASATGNAGLDGTTVADNNVASSAEGSPANRSQVFVTGYGVTAGVDHSIIAGNAPDADIAVNRGDTGTALTVSHSLVGSIHGSNSENRSVDEASSGLLGSDPALEPLADNGGLTQTRLPGSGSPAIDGGDTTVPTALSGEDQRGFPREDGTAEGTPPVNGSVDLGAVEVQDFNGDGTIDNLPPRFTGNLPGALQGVEGRSVTVNVLNYVTDPEGYVLQGTDVSFQGLPDGLNYDSSDGELSGTFDASGTFLVRATATDDLGATASLQEEVRVSETPPVVPDDDDDDELLGAAGPAWWFTLLGILGLVRRKRR